MIIKWAEQKDPLGLNEDSEVQRCPQCGVWGSKEVGCNSVICGYK